MRGTGSSKPIYLRGLPAQLVREAKANAARRGMTLAGFVAEALAAAIERTEGNADTMAAEPEADDLGAEMRWFEQNRARLAREHAGEYVAILQREVIDHDADFDALARRVFGKVGTRNVFMPRVSAQSPRPPLHLRSPRLEARATRSRPGRATRAR